MATHIVGKFLVGMTVVAACATVVTSLANNEERRASSTDTIITTEESSHRSGRMASRRDHDLNLLESSDNELATTNGKRVSQRLIGGHLKLDSESEDEEDLEGDEEDWEDGLLLSSAGNGKEERKNGSRGGEDEDEKKTLSQQVKEGKYGLIQNEIYPEKPKRPGIISYLGNPEVPRDTAKNLGGLDEEEIWLAENHVLVLRGGRFPDHGTNEEVGGRQKWPPIDNYKAPKRQIKIPSRPKVPPPFPVQLTEGGPVQIIRANGTVANDNNETANDDYDASPYYTGDFLPGEGPFFPFSANGSFPPDLTYPENSTGADGPLPNPNRQDKENLGPFYPPLPPGAVFLPPPNNQTDYDDEDQSIYYPPPYSFYYQQDNATAVPPGPLVPGIILPPPPDFFSALDEKKTTTKEKYAKRPTTTPIPKTHPTYLPPRRISVKPSKVRVTATSATTPKSTALPSPVNTNAIDRTKCKNVNNVTSAKSQQDRHGTVSHVETVTHAPETSRTVVNSNYHNSRQEIGNHVVEASTPEKNRWSAIVSSTAVPVLVYYATTTVSPLEQSSDATPVSIKSVVTTRRPTRLPNQASYYFYKETNDGVAGTTANPAVYYQTTTESPYYKVEPLPRQQPQKEYYSVEMVPSEQTAKDYSARLANSLIKEPAVYQRYSDSRVVANPTRYDSADSTRTQGQRMLVEPAPVYYQALSVNHPPAPKSYHTTEKPRYNYYQESQEPRYDYEQEPKSKPVYRYNYEVADYSEQSERPYYQQSTRQQEEFPYGEYQEIQNDYDGSDPVPEQQLHQQSVSSYKSQRPPSYPVTTARPIVNATPNPQHAYYTKQEEQLLDDVTKEYFSIFGKKLQDKGLPSTTPIYETKSSGTTERPDYNVNTYVANEYDVRRPSLYKTPKVKVQYGDEAQRPYSLEGDTLVNYKNPLPPINPDSEFISVDKPLPKQHSQAYRIPQVNRPSNQVTTHVQNYRTQPILQPVKEPAGNLVSVAQPINRAEAQEYRVHQEVVRPINRRPAQTWNYGPQRIVQQSSSNFETLGNLREKERSEYPIRPISLEGDVAVNYRNPRPPINPDAEFIDPISGQDSLPNKASSYFAYQLPGDGGHFYFLTPQAIAQRQDENDGGYLYPKPTGPRLVRRRRGPDNV